MIDYVSQIARLYRPLSGSVSDFEEEEDYEDESMGTQLLPTHHGHNLLAAAPVPLNKKTRLADVWDEHDEVFDIGADSDDGDNVIERPQHTQPGPPRIVVSHS